ncbi:hypothetical protein hmeg3_23675 [Herbaspirillum sp. meg3]|nr:hypothetical protein hmeg3_23675 [Herbaspirillum sp. meg3]
MRVIAPRQGVSMPFTRPPVVRPRHRGSRALPISSLIGASLLPLLGLTNAVQAQTLPGISAANIATMDLETTLQQVQQQRTQMQKQQSSDGTAANLAYASKLSAALTVLRQQLQQNPRPTAEQKQQLAQVEQSLTALTKVTQALAQPAKQGQSSSTSQEQQQLLQQIAQSVQSMLAQSGNPAGSPAISPESTKTQTESKNGPETKTSPGSKMTTAPESQSQEIARPGVEKSPGKSPSKPATTSEVMMHLAAGQGDGAAQAQAAIPPATSGAVHTANAAPAAASVPEGGAPQSSAGGTSTGTGTGSETATTAGPSSVPVPDGTTPGITVGAVGITGISTGGMSAGFLAAIMAATTAVSSSDGSSSATQGALQQQQQQQAATAATAAQQQSFNYVTAGLVTPLVSIPSSLSATYTGPINGTLNSGASIGGTLSASVNFATIRSGAPSIAGGITFNGNQGSTSFNLTLLGGYVGGAMSGTYAGQNVSGFIMNGQFFGPAAEQLAGAWSMQNTGGSLSATGTFKAKQ